MYIKFYLPTGVSKLRYGPVTMSIKTFTTSHKIVLKRDNINKFSLLVSDEYVLNSVFLQCFVAEIPTTK